MQYRHQLWVGVPCQAGSHRTGRIQGAGMRFFPGVRGFESGAPQSGTRQHDRLPNGTASSRPPLRDWPDPADTIMRPPSDERSPMSGSGTEWLREHLASLVVITVYVL